MSSVVVDAVEHLVRGIVDNPDDVRVDMVTSRRGRTVEVHVHPDDLGKVIGRGGRTATALRTLVAGLGGRGIRGGGEIPTDDPASRFAAGSSLRGRPSRGGPESRYLVESVRDHGGRLLIRLE